MAWVLIQKEKGFFERRGLSKENGAKAGNEKRTRCACAEGHQTKKGSQKTSGNWGEGFYNTNRLLTKEEEG